jgi:putative ABC transport system permease protein
LRSAASTSRLKSSVTASRSGAGSQFEATDIEHQIVVEVDSQQNVLPVAHMLRTLLTRFHENSDYEMVVPLELLEQRRQYQAVFNIALLLIAGISLLVGGIGIANIMLATVTERTREIGVRRAIGAKRRHVMSQFLIETVMLSAAGGVLGVITGYGGTLAMEWYTGWEAQFTFDVALWALAVSCAVGVLSGLFPAWRASHLDPIQALRYE